MKLKLLHIMTVRQIDDCNAVVGYGSESISFRTIERAITTTRRRSPDSYIDMGMPHVLLGW